MIFKAIISAWGKDTAYRRDAETWTKENPAKGQCAITALVVNDYFGGKIISGESTDGIVHFWNRVFGIKIDLTERQFKEKKKFKNLKLWDRNELLASGDVQNRYDILKRRVVKNLE